MPVEPKVYDADHDFGQENWLELMSTVRPGGPGGFGKNRAEDTIVGIIDSQRIPAAVRFCLGYSYTDDVNGAIIRVPPVQHPWFQHLYCDAVTFQPMYPTGNPLNPSNNPYFFTDPEFLYAFTRYGIYQKAQFSLHFSIPRYLIVGDADHFGEEWERYTYMFDTKPNLQLQSVEGSKLQFAEGTPKGLPIQSAIGIRMAITAHIMTWYQVPFDYLSELGYVPDQIIGRGPPSRIKGRVGNVNSVAMFNDLFEAGTIYLDNPQIDWYIQPVETEDGSRLWAADIELPFMHHDPDMGNPPSQPAWRGWNTFPWMGHQVGAENEGRWFTATIDGETTGTRLLPQTDLMALFNHWNT